MAKKDLIKEATEKGIPLTGKETVSALEKLLKEFVEETPVEEVETEEPLSTFEVVEAPEVETVVPKTLTELIREATADVERRHKAWLESTKG